MGTTAVGCGPFVLVFLRALAHRDRAKVPHRPVLSTHRTATPKTALAVVVESCTTALIGPTATATEAVICGRAAALDILQAAVAARRIAPEPLGMPGCNCNPVTVRPLAQHYGKESRMRHPLIQSSAVIALAAGSYFLPAAAQITLPVNQSF